MEYARFLDWVARMERYVYFRHRAEAAPGTWVMSLVFRAGRVTMDPFLADGSVFRVVSLLRLYWRPDSGKFTRLYVALSEGFIQQLCAAPMRTPSTADLPLCVPCAAAFSACCPSQRRAS